MLWYFVWFYRSNYIEITLMSPVEKAPSESSGNRVSIYESQNYDSCLCPNGKQNMI